MNAANTKQLRDESVREAVDTFLGERRIRPEGGENLPPSNKLRVMRAHQSSQRSVWWARRALDEYFRGESTQTAIENLLVDLHHFAAVERLDITELLAVAKKQFTEEQDRESKAVGE